MALSSANARNDVASTPGMGVHWPPAIGIRCIVALPNPE